MQRYVYISRKNIALFKFQYHFRTCNDCISGFRKWKFNNRFVEKSDIITLVIPLWRTWDIWYAIDGKHFARMITVHPAHRNVHSNHARLQGADSSLQKAIDFLRVFSKIT